MSIHLIKTKAALSVLGLLKLKSLKCWVFKLDIIFFESWEVWVKGQLAVPLTCTHLFFRAYIGISHEGVRWDRGLTSYPLGQLMTES